MSPLVLAVFYPGPGFVAPIEKVHEGVFRGPSPVSPEVRGYLPEISRVIGLPAGDYSYCASTVFSIVPWTPSPIRRRSSGDWMRRKKGLPSPGGEYHQGGPGNEDRDT